MKRQQQQIDNAFQKAAAERGLEHAQRTLLSGESPSPRVYHAAAYRELAATNPIAAAQYRTAHPELYADATTHGTTATDLNRARERVTSPVAALQGALGAPQAPEGTQAAPAPAGTTPAPGAPKAGG